MKRTKFIIVVACFVCSGLNSLQAQWTVNGSNLYPTNTSLNVGIGTTTPASKLDVNGDIHVLNSSSFISGSLAGHRIKLFSDGWDGYVNYSTNLYFTSSDNIIRQTITSTGYVGIGTITPTQALTVTGRVSMAPSGTVSDEKYNGNIIITKPTTSGQYINLIRDGQYPWSIGTIYNRSSFAIGKGMTNDTAFTSPFFTINTDGNVGIRTTEPTQALNVTGRVAITSSATPSEEHYNGSIIITKPTTSGQYINLIRNGQYPWSIGTVYNSNSFAIGTGMTNDTVFTSPFFTINTDGNVGIGTISPSYKLDVKGTIRAQEVLVNMDGADFVFDENYKLKPIQEVYEFVKENKHLPEVSAAADMVKNGVNMGEFQVKLLQKVEELTLYMAEQNRMIQEQQTKMVEQQEKIKELENRLNK